MWLWLPLGVSHISHDLDLDLTSMAHVTLGLQDFVARRAASAHAKASKISVRNDDSNVKFCPIPNAIRPEHQRMKLSCPKMPHKQKHILLWRLEMGALITSNHQPFQQGNHPQLGGLTIPDGWPVIALACACASARTRRAISL